MSDGSSKLGRLKSRQVLLVVALVVILAFAAGGWYFFSKYQQAKKEIAQLSNPQEAARLETERLRSEVAQLVELPANEEPTIATVVDADKLKSQAFFANAQNGDRVLMFPQAKKAVLYRPSTKKIIEIAPINIGNTQGASTSTPTTTNKTTNP